MSRRWSKPKERVATNQLSLPGCGFGQFVREPSWIETRPVPQGKIDTSREAASDAERGVIALRELVLALVRGAGQRGVTCDEVAAATGRMPNQVSPRFTELSERGLIQRSGQRRHTRAGSTAHVWVRVV